MGDRRRKRFDIALNEVNEFFEEIRPTMNVADRIYPVPGGKAYAWPVRGAVAILSPIVSSVQYLVWKVLGLFGVEQTAKEEIVPAHDEIRGTVELHHQEGGVEREHRDMIGGILDLRELTINEVMIHRKNMITADADESAQKMIEEIAEGRVAQHQAVDP